MSPNASSTRDEPGTNQEPGWLVDPLLFAARRYVTSRLPVSVCPSVCSSVTLVYCIKTAKDLIVIFLDLIATSF